MAWNDQGKYSAHLFAARAEALIRREKSFSLCEMKNENNEARKKGNLALTGQTNKTSTEDSDKKFLKGHILLELLNTSLSVLF